MTKNKMRASLRSCLLSSAIVLTVAAIAHANGQEQTFDIASQPLMSALTLFSRQSNVDVTAPAELVAGKQAPAVTGSMPPQQALRLLLAGSGLKATSDEKGPIVIQATGKSSPTFITASDAAERLPPANLIRLASATPTAVGSPETSDNEAAPALDTIVVTAQRREENLQQVPISVSAVSAQELQNTGISSTDMLPQVVPSVQFTRSGPSGLFFIRGVGTTNAAAGEEAANAVYVDGVYMGDLSQTINHFNNIDRVEVLEGPQGTLFGRNSTGGLIQVITLEPGDTLVAKGQVGYANYQMPSGQFYVGGPIADKLSADIAFTGLDQQEGWGRNLTAGTENQSQELWGFRSKVVWRPADGVKLTLAGDYDRDYDDIGLGWRLSNIYPGTGGFFGPSGNDTTANNPARNAEDVWGVSLTAVAELGFADLTSITALRESRTQSGVDVDAGPLNLTDLFYVLEGRTVQEEVRLASAATDPLSWQAGFFFLRDDARANTNVFGDNLTAGGLQDLNIVAGLNTNSYAVFGETTYAITSTTRLTGGFRYTMDRRSFDGGQTPILLGGVVLPASSQAASLDYNEPSYRAAIRQDITSDINAYFSFNRSFKSGTFNLQAPLDPPVKPMFINAYELGLKSELFERKLRLNVAGYHYDISDYQILSAESSSSASSILLNAASVKVDGVDVNFEVAPTQPLRIFGAFTVLNSRYSKFGGQPLATTLQAPIIYPSPAICPANLAGTQNPGELSPGPRTGGFTTCFGDAAGNEVAQSPKFVGSIGSSYTMPVQADGNVQLTLLYTYNSGYVFDPNPLVAQGSFGLLNGSLEYRPTKHYGIQLWANNITNRTYILSSLETANSANQAIGAPRTFGINLKFEL